MSKHRNNANGTSSPSSWNNAMRGLLACLVVGAGLVVTGSASEAGVRVAGQAHAATYVGVETFEGVIGVCTGNGRAAPTVTTPPSRVHAPLAAWALHVAGPDGSGLDDTTGAAIATIVKNDPAVPNNHKNATPDVGVRARVDQIVAEATAYAGARSIPLSVASSSPTPGQTWQLTGVGIQAPGAWMPSRAIDLAISGPVVFEATGTSTITITSTGAPRPSTCAAPATASSRSRRRPPSRRTTCTRTRPRARGTR